MIWIILIIVFLFSRKQSSSSGSGVLATLLGTTQQSAAPGNQPPLGQHDLQDVETVIPAVVPQNMGLGLMTPNGAVVTPAIGPNPPLGISNAVQNIFPVDETPARPAIDPVPLPLPGNYYPHPLPPIVVAPGSILPNGQGMTDALVSVQSVDVVGAAKPLMTPRTQIDAGGYAY
jgi:hypothetical protein